MVNAARKMRPGAPDFCAFVWLIRTAAGRVPAWPATAQGVETAAIGNAEEMTVERRTMRARCQGHAGRIPGMVGRGASPLLGRYNRCDPAPPRPRDRPDADLEDAAGDRILRIARQRRCGGRAAQRVS